MTWCGAMILYGQLAQHLLNISYASQRYMTLARNAFSGTPTLIKEEYTVDQVKVSLDTSDIL